MTVTANVTSSGAAVTAGSVQFIVDGTSVATVALDASGSATIALTTLNIGTHAIEAVFGGNSLIAPSTGTISHVVSKVPSTVGLVSSGSPANIGDNVTFTATAASGGSPVTAGSIRFELDGILIAIIPVDASGAAQFSTSALSDGDHDIVAHYSGTATIAESTSTTLTQFVSLVADAGGPYSVDEGGSVSLDAGASTVGMTYMWELDGDGTFDISGAAPTLDWSQLEAHGIDGGPSSHTITLRVSSPNSHSDATAVLTVGNSAPAATITGGGAATVGVPYTLKVGADDPSSGDALALFTYTVDWGDGSPLVTLVGPADPPVSHTYTRSGTFTVTVTAEDQDGAVSAAMTHEVLVSPAPVGPSAPGPSGLGLSTTGGDPQPLGWAGIALLLAGGLFAVVSARRKSRLR